MMKANKIIIESFSPLGLKSVRSSNVRSMATGTRGARGHGWYVNYRAGKGGRHLQGEYWDRESPAEMQAWNNAILKLGKSKVFLDVVAEPRIASEVQSRLVRNKKVVEVPPLDSLTGEKFRLTIDIASTIMPQTCNNFMELLPRYVGTSLYRVEKKVGLYGGDVLTNTGKTGQAFAGKPMTMMIDDPLCMWHIPGTVTMVVPTVDEIDSRFLLCAHAAPHLDGMQRAFGKLDKKGQETVYKWETTLLTRFGIPAAYDLIVVETGILNDNRNKGNPEEEQITTPSESQAVVETSA
jgi:cyclophilin family peptidyl-prolyl cis-trans isomerase